MSETTEEIIEEVKELEPSDVSPSLIQEAKEVLEPVAEKIGEGAEFGYEIVMRQVIAEAVANFLIALILTMIGLIIWKKIVVPISSKLELEKESVRNQYKEDLEKYQKRKAKGDYVYRPIKPYEMNMDSYYFFKYMTLLVITTVGGIPTVVNFVYLIKVLINPHYYTIKELIRLAEGVL